MRLRHLIITGLLAAVSAAPTVDAAPQLAQPDPSVIVLDGIATISGDKQALFKVSFSNGAPEADFILAEGQTRCGIQLLAVDARTRTVLINHEGHHQTIAICQTPTLLTATTDVAAAAATASNDHSGAIDPTQTSGNESPPADPPRFAHPVYAAGWSGGPNGTPGTPNGTAGDSGDNATSANNSSAGGSSNAGGNATGEHLYQWWVNDAQKIEQARLETAQRVLAGEWQPYPLTPLTPPGTAPQLIGPDSVFMEHGPGMMLPGN